MESAAEVPGPSWKQASLGPMAAVRIVRSALSVPREGGIPSAGEGEQFLLDRTHIYQDTHTFD